MSEKFYKRQQGQYYCAKHHLHHMKPQPYASCPPVSEYRNPLSSTPEAAFETWWRMMLAAHVEPNLKELCRFAWAAAQAAERERCAKLCEDEADKVTPGGHDVDCHLECSIAIRSTLRATPGGAAT